MKFIEFDNPHRQKHFEFFRNMNHPHFSISANVDITSLLEQIKSKQLPFMPTIAWLVSKSANELPPFCQRIREDKVVEHETIHPSFAVDTEASDVFSFCEVRYVPSYTTFKEAAIIAIEGMKNNPSFEDEPGRDDYLFLSSIPWISFTGITHAMNYHPHDSVPRITWGKYFKQDIRMLLPLAVQVHHALVDGKYVGYFFRNFEKYCQMDLENK